MFCLVCNTQNPVATAYCEACGEPLRPADKSEYPAAGRGLRPERHLERERNWRNL